MALLCIHYKLFWVDELLEYYSDAKPSIAAVMFGQLHYPFSFEPPAFHVLLHLMGRVLPASSEFSFRVISAFSLVMTEVCVFLVTFRLSRDRGIALFAMSLPFWMVTFNYAAEGRVYSFLTMLFALALLCYQGTVAAGNQGRRWALAGLALALSLAGLVHYYGLFLCLVFVVAEIARSYRNRRLDWPVAIALALSCCAFALDLPYIHALGFIRSHYYNTGETQWIMAPATYLWLVISFFVFHLLLNYPLARPPIYLSGIAGVVIYFVCLWRSRRSYASADQWPVYLAVALGSALPIVNLIVAHFVTHAYVPRYSLPAVAAISIGLALLLAPWLRNVYLSAVATSVLVLCATLHAAHAAAGYKAARQAEAANVVLGPQLQTALAAVPDQHIYIQGAAEFLVTYYYAPPPLRERLVNVESGEEELRWLGRNTSSALLRNISITTPLPVVSLDCLRRVPGPHVFVVFRDREEEWIFHEIDQEGIQAEWAGRALDGSIYRITLTAPETRQSVEACVLEIRSGQQ